MQNAKFLAIFDLDGTLVDSVFQIATILNRIRELFGFKILPISFYEENVGLPIDDLIYDLELPSFEKSELIRNFRVALLQDIQAGNNFLFEGVTEAMKILTEQGVSLAIATSKPTDIAVAVYKNSGLSQFPFHIQGTDGFAPKPSPDVIDRVLDFLPGARALMVGDRTEDVQAAIGANIPCIGIASGAHSRESLEEMGAIFSYSSFLEFTRNLSANSGLITSSFR